MYEATVVGYRHNQGTYQGVDYENYKVHVVADAQIDGHVGQIVMEVKIGKKMNYVPRVGDRIELYYGPQGLERVAHVASAPV